MKKYYCVSDDGWIFDDEFSDPAHAKRLGYTRRPDTAYRRFIKRTEAALARAGADYEALGKAKP